MAFRLRRVWVAVGLFLMTALFCNTAWRPDIQAKEVKETHPLQILIIRHAEKPPDDANSVDLSDEGQKRADALPQLFKASRNRPNPFPTPDFIFATKNSKNSHRPVETVTPLAANLNLTINSSFADDEGAKLAHELFYNPTYANKTILICWHHGAIPDLAEKLNASGAPDRFDKSVFDRVWKIAYDEMGKTTFSDIPQQLLPNDSQK